jgi:hypothetical protein
MALWVCEGTYDGEPCRTRYAVGLFRCPRCHGTTFHELGSRPEDQEDPMSPKITRHGGPSSATLRPPADDQPVVELPLEAEPGADLLLEAADVEREPGAGEPMTPVDGGTLTVEPNEPVPGGMAEGGAGDGAPSRPSANARNELWVDYLVHQGLVRAALEGMTKRELRVLQDALDAGTHVVGDDGTLVEVAQAGTGEGDDTVPAEASAETG